MNNRSKKLIPISLFYILLSTTIVVGAENTDSNNSKLPIDDLQRFSTVLENIKNYYVNPIDDHILFNNAIRGMLNGLDPHSSYLDKDEFTDLKVSTTGKFGGLGIEVTLEDGFIRVISPIDDTPAKKAGIEAGDLIIRLNDKAIRGMALREAVDLMRGKPGTTIELTILRKQSAKPLKITVARDIINVQSVRHSILDKNNAYLRISQFQNDTGDEVIRQIRAIKKAVGNNLNGLILDLRNNPGGIFESSVTTVNAFLDKDRLKYDGLIVYTKGRIAKSEIKEYAKGKDILNNLPIVVLINGGSASASEIVAGALQDHKRAIILGTKSFGKGSVQTVLPLKDNRGLKLTTALYYTPSGRSIQATGITPDLLVENRTITTDNPEPDLISIKESDLQGHLLLNNAEANKPNGIANDGESAKTAEQDATNSKINNDYQLFQGLMVLKSMNILNSQK
ncbi:MAG: S41 family peptidase [Gammaproteobacteria bacterium]|jgi:carboxyl-terminal processing protease